MTEAEYQMQMGMLIGQLHVRLNQVDELFTELVRLYVELAGHRISRGEDHE